MNNLTKVFVGQISLSDGVAMITDPCYNKNNWCSEKVRVKHGAYNCYAYMQKKNKKSIRIMQILVANGAEAAYASKCAEDDANWKLLDYAEVDSGTLGIFQNKPDFSDQEWYDLCEWMYDAKQPHNSNNVEKCYIRIFKNGGNGYWVNVPGGDGAIPIYKLCDKSGTIIGLEIQF